MDDLGVHERIILKKIESEAVDWIYPVWIGGRFS
jgi:hypothetical protein